MTSALNGVGGQRYAPAAFTPGKDPVPILQEANHSRRNKHNIGIVVQLTRQAKYT